MLKITVILAFGLSLAYSAAVIDDGAPTKVNKEEPKLPANPPVEPVHPVNGREGRAEGFQMDPVMANPYTYQTSLPGGANTVMHGSAYNFPPPPPPEVIRKAMEVLMSDSPLVRRKPSRPASKLGLEPLFMDMSLHKAEVASGIVGTVAVSVLLLCILGAIFKLTLGIPLFGLKSLLFKKIFGLSGKLLPGKWPLPFGLPPLLPPIVPLGGLKLPLVPLPIIGKLPFKGKLPLPVPIPLPAPGSGALPGTVPVAGAGVAGGAGVTVINQGNGENPEFGILLPNNPTGAGIIVNDESQREDYAENEADAESRSSYTNMILPLLQHVMRGIEKYTEMNEKED